MKPALGVAAMAAALWGCAAGGGLDRGEVIRRVVGSTVQLRADREGGVRRAASGVVVASDSKTRRTWIVTARHFLDPPVGQQVYVSVPGERGRVAATIVARSADIDLAVLEVTGLVLQPIRFKEETRLGDDVWVVAFPWGRRQTIVSGVVSQLAGEEGDAAVTGPARMVDASVSYGSSGGGVFDALTGELIGVVEGYRTARVAVPETQNRTLELPVPGETTVIPAGAVRRFLDDAGVGERPAR
jgi:serine protease Do